MSSERLLNHQKSESYGSQSVVATATNRITDSMLASYNRRSTSGDSDVEMLLCSSDDEDNTDKVMDTGMHRDVPSSSSRGSTASDVSQRRTRDVVQILDRPMSPPSIEYTYEDVKETPKYYDNFHTIDWVRDRSKDRARHKKLLKNQRISYSGFFQKFMDAGSGWLLVFLVGVSAGLLAGIIDVGAEWASDLKEGVCPHNFFYNKDSCCWLSNDTFLDDGSCDHWHTWARIFGVKKSLDAYFLNFFLYICFALLFGSMAGLFVISIAPYASGSGIPEVKTILSGFIIRGYLGAWTLIVKAVGMVLAVGAGLSLGKEGPLVHVACCCGNLFTRLFPKYRNNEGKKREILSAAAAAGVSVAFGAPVGGVLFSLEEVSYYFPHKVMWRSFFAALAAAFTLQLMHPYFSGEIVLFYVDYSHQWHLFEFVPFVLLGILGGLFGAVFIKLNLIWSKIRKTKLKNIPFPLIEVMVISLVTGILSYPNPYTRANASEVIRTLFSQCGPEDNNDLCDYIRTGENISEQYHDTEAGPKVYAAMWQLTLAMVAKGILTIFTFGMKVPAGLFIPSMFVGACMGRVTGIGMEQIAYQFRDTQFFELFCDPRSVCVTPGLYAMIGAAAALGGVTRMTVSLVVIMFELTGGLNYIVPIMVAVMISKWVGDAIIADGIYDGHILLNGYPFLDSKADYNHDALVCDVMSPKQGEAPLTTVDLSDCTIGSLRNLVEETNFFGFPCILSADTQLLAGFITRRDIIQSLERVDSQKDAGICDESRVFFMDSAHRLTQTALDSEIPSVNIRGIMDPSPFQISDQTTMITVVDMFRKLGLRQVLVSYNGRLLGIVTKKDVLTHISDVEHKNSHYA